MELLNRKSQCPFTKNGFTLIEMLVVIAIIAVLASMLMPAMEQARQTAYKGVCTSNLKQIGIATNMYAEENNGLGLDYRQYRGSTLWIWNQLLAGTRHWSKSDGINEITMCPLHRENPWSSAELPYTDNWSWFAYGMNVGYSTKYFRLTTNRIITPIGGGTYDHFYVNDENTAPSKRIYIMDGGRGTDSRVSYFRIGRDKLNDGGQGILDMSHAETANGLAVDMSVQSIGFSDAIDANIRDVYVNGEGTRIQ